MADPKLVEELRQRLRERGASEDELNRLNLDNLPDEVAQGVVAGMSVPQSQKAGIGMAMLIDGVSTGGPVELGHVFRLAAAAAASGGTFVLTGIVIAIATAAAAVLPLDDDRTPADFLRMIEARFDDPSGPSFDSVKAEWHGARAEQDIRSDLGRIADGDFGIGDIIGPEE